MAAMTFSTPSGLFRTVDKQHRRRAAHRAMAALSWALVLLGTSRILGCGSSGGDEPSTGSGAATTTAASTGSGPGLKMLADACTAGDECASGNCVDDVCCDTKPESCGGCKACNVAGSLGTCSNVPAQSDPHDTCAGGTTMCTLEACAGDGTCGQAPSGTMCDTDMVCDAGACVACAEGMSCTMNPGAPCKLGMLSCSTGMPQCLDAGDAAMGLGCGKDLACDGKGACVSTGCNGTPLLPGPPELAVGKRPASVTSGDFNGDTKLDLAVANSNSNNVSVLLRQGNGTFALAVHYAVGDPESVTSGDFNGDTKLDLAVGNYKTYNVSVLLGNGNGTFAAAVPYAAGSSPESVTSGDFNGDTKLDLAVANSGSNTVSVMLYTGCLWELVRVGAAHRAVAG
jgi:hypothetical protein